MPAVPEMIAALKHRRSYVRMSAAIFLGEMHVLRAVDPLVKALKDRNEDVRVFVAQTLGQLEDSTAVAALIAALQDRCTDVGKVAARALQNIGAGKPETLPRKILVESRLSVQERIDLLERMRHINYKYVPDYSWEDPFRLYYEFPDTRTLCQIVLNEEDTEFHKEAQAVLDWLAGGHPSVPAPYDNTSLRQRLLSHWNRLIRK